MATENPRKEPQQPNPTLIPLSEEAVEFAFQDILTGGDLNDKLDKERALIKKENPIISGFMAVDMLRLQQTFGDVHVMTYQIGEVLFYRALREEARRKNTQIPVITEVDAQVFDRDRAVSDDTMFTFAEIAKKEGLTVQEVINIFDKGDLSTVSESSIDFFNEAEKTRVEERLRSFVRDEPALAKIVREFREENPGEEFNAMTTAMMELHHFFRVHYEREEIERAIDQPDQ
ncbi:hypothetical protein A3G67_00345 [Candidatus Roizmanbacteria bacterium RIFCSPLOWO2_12_FULL_40_12]|uniref:Uncharacterized protein n=1 Tax=Candidatus Roizmanbacteria bacterium RIFCSPLOWO2_01_FULL_40_42 TaxID=1802066 RepID=A0A1F7J6G5_9BACT|nr:MAG: hypothetical protein A2779_02565 [Candidatus Roizmanbacteria bacterium RIFCSPHIGHO2_01_FULL_40_98]OGK29103.1 MAG: hypothetical protein A3C31_03350 [Candidatus Roizmanbacteria bacterium RIFCSPHIGHO2_02_FULL_40_53]OGK29309.1 MAG: hypothetical protein A2W49_05030 [Candidatus Roizmanbacteria bacterium RIFCSPHIGHO2_12_41_18]OGK36008.1 MAG: hypothetical protein A3E69_03120 [Candidatus Roizmanbacteria bacterium RIFCSPHIGHO2_12_FULL_40_130]OGK51205.1 MAG: hypothetical protein A3B50_03230 [Candi